MAVAAPGSKKVKYSSWPASTSPSSACSEVCCSCRLPACAATGPAWPAFVFALFGFGFSMYLTYLELWTIKAICQWCIASAVAMTMLFVAITLAPLRILRYLRPRRLDGTDS
ncbi:MAG: hypothetical protein IPK93_12215 [Solirubrobacterales bacterium]|nr:hypothetical protein [Solirubrobacterales bacterium]